MYVLLEPGDIIREGDEYRSIYDYWAPVSTAIKYAVTAGKVYRRHLEPWEAVKHALESIPDTDATTTYKFWDCECEENYVHESCGDLYCETCDSYLQDQPDSRLREVLLAMLKEKTS